MKHNIRFLLLMTAAALVAGCDEKRTTTQQLDGVQSKTEEVAQNIRDYSFAQKDEFIKAERIHLADLNRELDELATRVDKSTAAVKAEAEPRIETLRGQTARLNKQLDEASITTESSWEKFKDDVRRTNDASKEEFKKARQWLSDKIAP